MRNGRSGYLKRPNKFVRFGLVARATTHADVIRNADISTFPVAHQNFTISVELARVESVHFTYRFDDGSPNFRGF